VIEFIPYVFQVFAHLLYFQPEGRGLSPAYQGLFEPCLSPALWERKGNVPALTELMKAYIMRGLDYIVRRNLLEPVLGIFQRMLGNRASETSAFALIDTLVNFSTLDIIGQYMSTILQLIMMRMQQNKTPRLFKLVVTFLCTVAIKFGPEIIEQTLDGLQQGLLATLVEQTWLPTTSVLVMSDRVDAKIIVAGGARILTETSIRQNHQLFAGLFQSLLEVCDPLAAVSATVELALDEEEDRTFDATYSRLAFSKIPHYDPLPEVTDLGAALVTAVAKLCAFERGVVSCFARCNASWRC
jgi:exportin-2 (importin alpha re-exporter)